MFAFLPSVFLSSCFILSFSIYLCLFPSASFLPHFLLSLFPNTSALLCRSLQPIRITNNPIKPSEFCSQCRILLLMSLHNSSNTDHQGGTGEQYMILCCIHVYPVARHWRCRFFCHKMSSATTYQTLTKSPSSVCAFSAYNIRFPEQTPDEKNILMILQNRSWTFKKITVDLSSAQMDAF